MLLPLLDENGYKKSFHDDATHTKDWKISDLLTKIQIDRQMGNTQQQGKYFIKAVNAFDSNSKRRFRRVQFSDEDDERWRGAFPLRIDAFGSTSIPFQLQLRQSFCVVITNQPQVFWLASSSVPVVGRNVVSTASCF